MYLINFAGTMNHGRIRARAVGVLGNRAVIQKVLDRLEERVNRNPMKLNKDSCKVLPHGRKNSLQWCRLDMTDWGTALLKRS